MALAFLGAGALVYGLSAVGIAAEEVISRLFDDDGPSDDTYTILQKAKPGDLLEFKRKGYSHYALYLGGGMVMNIDPKDKSKAESLITRKTVAEVANGDCIGISNHDDYAEDRYNVVPKPVDEILRAARSNEDRKVPYSFTKHNCEYYSTLWRFGKGFTTQTDPRPCYPCEHLP